MSLLLLLLLLLLVVVVAGVGVTALQAPFTVDHSFAAVSQTRHCGTLITTGQEKVMPFPSLPGPQEKDLLPRSAPQGTVKVYT